MAKSSGTDNEMIRLQTSMIDIMMDTFKSYLVPSDIILKLNIEASIRDEILELEHVKRGKAAKKLVKAVLDNPVDKVSLFINALRETGFKRFIDVLDDRIPKGVGKADQLEMLLGMLEGELTSRLDPARILPGLVTLLNEGDDEEILAIQDRRGMKPACIHLFRCMKRKDPLWIFKFLEVMHDKEPHILLKLGPHFQNQSPSDVDDKMDDDDDDADDAGKRKHDVDDNKDGGIQNKAMSMDTDQSQTLVKAMSMDTDQSQTLVKVVTGDRPIADHDVVDVGEAHEVEDQEPDWRDALSDEDDSGNEDEDYPPDGQPDLRLREYQYELANKHAIHGRNTVICAPTGSGKTRVALYIVREHLNKGDDQRNRKVVFLARTVPLVNQQFSAFKKFLGTWRIKKVTGDCEDSSFLHASLDQYDIIVMTPQILVNQMTLSKIKSINIFSMIVLDECHHTRKGEPYNRLMLMYLKTKNRSALHLPQVVGLTASLGVEKATTDEDATENIIKLMSNMDISRLSTVEEHLDELKALVPVPEERTIALADNSMNPARKEIEKVMFQIEQLLLKANEPLNEDSIDGLLMKMPSDRLCQSYGQWAVNLKREAHLVPTSGSHAAGNTINTKKADASRSLVVMAEHLFRYNTVLDINQYVRIIDVFDYLTKEFSHACQPDDNTVHDEYENKLFKLLDNLKKTLMKFEILRKHDDKYDNPNLGILSRILKERLNACRETGSEERAILFVRTRATCFALMHWLNKDEKVDQELKDLNAYAFTGAGAHETEGGMTQNEQDKVISKFRCGDIKLIVCTSVAEEGLDIPDCNTVIKFNAIGNEITTMQTRGRCRKAGGTSILLADNKVQEKEMLNVVRTSMMQRSIQTINNMPHDRVVRKITFYQEETLAELANKEMAEKNRNDQKLDVTFQLLCVRCKTVCTDESRIRVINNSHHVVIGREFIQEKVIVIPYPKNKRVDCVLFTGNMQCKSCHAPWGVVFIFQGESFACLGAKSFIVLNKVNNERRDFSKWVKFPYKLADYTPADFQMHIGVANNKSEDENDDIDSDDSGDFDLC